MKVDFFMATKLDIATLLNKPPARANTQAVTAALRHSAALTSDKRKRGFVELIVDCTGSRSPQWVDVQMMTVDLLTNVFAKSSVPVTLGLTVFSGDTVRRLGRFAAAPAAREAMLGISCEAGETQLCKATDIALSQSVETPPAAMIYIGDHFEEKSEALDQRIDTLKKRNIVAHAFHDASIPGQRTTLGGIIYNRLATETGGVFSVLGVQANLSELCTAVITHAVEGVDAYQKLLASGHKGARAIASQINRPQLGFKK